MPKSKLKTKKFMVGSEVEFGGSVITVEKVQNQDLIFIAPKSMRIRAFEELRRPETKKRLSGLLRNALKFTALEPNSGLRDLFY